MPSTDVIEPEPEEARQRAQKAEWDRKYRNKPVNVHHVMDDQQEFYVEEWVGTAPPEADPVDGIMLPIQALTKEQTLELRRRLERNRARDCGPALKGPIYKKKFC